MLFPVTLLKKPPSQVFFKQFDHRFENSYITELLSVAASNIHKFFTSFTKLVLEMKLLLDLTVLKRYVEISNEPAKICSKLTIKTPERHQLTSLQCLYCKLYKHFTTSLVFVPLTLNMNLFTGSSLFVKICERYLKFFRRKAVALQIWRKLCNV